MTYNDFLMAHVVASARAEKAIMRRMSRRASIRRQQRAVSRTKAKDNQAQDY